MPTIVESVVNEGSTATLIAVVRDSSDNPITPTSMSYSIHDVATETEVRASTSLTPASSNSISLTENDNVILSSANAYERRRITLQSTLPGGGAQNAEYVYTVKRLRGLT